MEEKYMKQAIEQAKKALAIGEVPIGCVIVYDGKVIGRGYNRRMTDKNTFYNMLKSNAESQPDAVAVVYDTMKVTYAKLFDDVTKKALHFQKFEGKRIAISE